jgi:hypothetical protein
MRRVTTARAIRLNEKRVGEFLWEVLRGPIERLYVIYAQEAADEVRSEGELESFTVRE